MLIQGPLLLDWGRRKWGVVPRIENGCLQANQPPTIDRLDAWLRARVQVPARPDWFFVKLHTHGAPEANRHVLLGEPMVRFHEALADRAAADPDFHLPLRDGPRDVQPGPAPPRPAGRVRSPTRSTTGSSGTAPARPPRLRSNSTGSREGEGLHERDARPVHLPGPTG